MAHLPGPLRFARMAGSSIAAPGAIAWVTDFLNAAYYARAESERDVRDLRLAHGIITTRWARRGGGRLGALDVLALNRAYGMLRLRRRGRLDHDALLEGARMLVGDWFPDAWWDDERRAYGIAFPTAAERRAFHPGAASRPCRTRPADAAPAIPCRAGVGDLRSGSALPTLVQRCPSWRSQSAGPTSAPPPGASRRCASTGLAGQTFEIEVVAEPTPRSPVFTRGYVTCTDLHLHDDPESGLAGRGRRSPRALRGRGGAGRAAPAHRREPSLSRSSS